MKKRRFGIDIDGTVTDPATFVPYINEHFEKSFTLDDITEYDLSKIVGIQEADFWKWMQLHEENIYSQSNLAPDVKGILTKWKSLHELFYISARPTKYHGVTTDWFHRQEIPYDRIELIGSHDKLASVKKHAIEIFFEDKHDNACAIAEECTIPVILLDTPYNRDPVPSLVYRVQNWQDARTVAESILK